MNDMVVYSPPETIEIELAPSMTPTERVVALKHIENKSKWLIAEEFYRARLLSNTNQKAFQEQYNGYNTFREWCNAPEDLGGCDYAQSIAYKYAAVYEAYHVNMKLPPAAYKELEAIDWAKLDMAKARVTPTNYKKQIERIKSKTRKELRASIEEETGEPIGVKTCKHAHTEYVMRCNDCDYSRILSTKQAVLRELFIGKTRAQAHAAIDELYDIHGK